MPSLYIPLASVEPSSSAPLDGSTSGLSVGRRSSLLSPSILASLFPQARGRVRAVVLYSPGHRPPQQQPALSRAEYHEQVRRSVHLNELRGFLEGKPGFASGTALSVLLQPRLHCDHSHTASAARLSKQLTQGAHKKRFVEPLLVGREWPDARALPSEVHFVHAVRRLKTPPLSQTQRVLGNEADASTAFVSNVLNPALAVLQHFLDADLRQSFEIVLLSEVVAEETVVDDGRAGEKGSSPSSLRLDHVFALVSTQKNAKGERLLRPQKALVIIEMKRYNLVRHEDWPNDLHVDSRKLDPKRDARAYKLLPQLLLYALKWKCSRVYLSDYVRSLALDIDFTKVGSKHPIPIALKFCADASRRRDSVYDSGVRAAITFDAVEALRARGVANRNILGGRHPKLDADLAAHLAALGQQRVHT